MTVPISNISRRQVFGATGQTTFAFTFEILDQDDIAVFVDDTLKTITTDYSVSINSNGTGLVQLNATAVGAAQVSIIGNRTIERTSDFTTGGDLFANTLNTELDSLTIFAQQNSEGLERSLRAPETDPVGLNMTLPRVSERAGKYLAFGSAGEAIGGATNIDISGIQEFTAEISALGGLSSELTALAQHTAELSALGSATMVGHISAVSTISTEVQSVSNQSANIVNILGITADLATVGTADNISNISTVAGISSAVETVASITASISNLLDSTAEIAGVFAISSDVQDVASIGSARLQEVVNMSSNIVNVLTSTAEIATVAGVGTATLSAIANATADMTNVAAIQTHYNKTYAVTVAGGKFYFNGSGTSAVTIDLHEGGTFVFDQSDASNATHYLQFSTTNDGSHNSGTAYSAGVTTVGTPGTAGASTTIEVEQGAPTLYYYCTVHSGMGGQANTPKSDLDAVSDINSEIQTVAGIQSDVTQVAALSSNIASLLEQSSQITGLSGISAEITSVSNLSANIVSVVGNSANIVSVAADIDDVSVVATNLTDVTSFADLYRGASSAAPSGASFTTGTLFYDLTNLQLKIWNGTVFDDAAFDITGTGVNSFNTRTGAITLTSADVTTAVGHEPISTGKSIAMAIVFG